MEPFTAALTPRDFTDSPRSEIDVTPRGPTSLFPDPSPRNLVSARRLKKQRPSALAQWVTGGGLTDRSLQDPPNIAQRRLFRYNSDSIIPTSSDEKAMLKAFKAALSTESFEVTLNEMSQSLYQRKAQIDYIDRDHESWGKALESSYEDSLKAWTGADSFYRLIPLLKDPKKIAKALSCMISLEAVMPPLELKYNELCCLLESPQHREALQFYKVQKRACKQLKHKPSLDEKVDLLASILLKVEDKFQEKKRLLPGKDNIVVKQTALLYEELLRFIKYTANTLKPENALPEEQAPPPQEVQNSSWGWGWTMVGYGWAWGYTKAASPREKPPVDPEKTALRVNILFERIQTIEGTLTAAVIQKRHHNQPKMDEATKTIVTKYVEACSEDSLQNEDDFRNGRLFTTTRGIGPYRELREPVEQLRACARALARLLATLKERRADLCKGNIEPQGHFQTLSAETEYYNTILNGLVELISEQEEVLTTLPLTNRVHAGWYYIARLLVKANDVRRFAAQFKKLADNDFTYYATAIKRLIEYLDPKEASLANNRDYFTSAIATDRLWASLKSACRLAKPVSQHTFSEKLRHRIYETIDQILAVAGPRTLELSNTEKLIPGKLFIKTPLEQFKEANEEDLGMLPKSLMMYLLKGFLKSGYYSDTEIDPQFDAVLTTLELDPLYTGAFFRTLEKDAFRTYYEAYNLQSDRSDFRKEIQLLTEAVGTLVSLSHAGSIQALFCYCKARQMLCDLKKMAASNTSHQHKQRIDWLENMTNTTLKDFEFTFPEFFPHLETIDARIHQESSIYKLVVSSLYAQDSAQQEATSKAVMDRFGRLDPNTAYTNRFMQELLQGWALAQYMLSLKAQTGQISQLLNDLFTSYLVHDSQRTLWRGLHGIGYMETALYQYTLVERGRTRELDYIFKEIDNSRGSEHFKAWQTVMGSYLEFTYLIKGFRSELIDGTHSYDRMHSFIHNAKAALGEAAVEVQNRETATHIGIIRWCILDMLSKYVLLRREEFFALLKKQPNERFILNSDDYKKAQGILDDLTRTFGEQVPIEGNFPAADPEFSEARKARIEIGYTFQFNTVNIPLHMPAGKEDN